MSHTCSRGQSDKRKVLHVFNRHLKTADTHGCVFNLSSADCACVNHCSKAGGQHKMKRLKTRKERSQMRGAKIIPHHQHHQSRKHATQLHYCCQNNCYCPSKRDAVVFPRIVLAAQEPSIITDSRLIGHHGLFNHEVKSVDIERFLSKQRKVEKHEQQAREKSTAASHSSAAASHNPSPKAHNVCQKEEKTNIQSNSQGSDITPGQRQLGLSSESENATSPLGVAKSQKATSEARKHRKLQWTPRAPSDVKIMNKKVKRRQITTLEHTPKNQDPPDRQKKARVPSPGPPPLSNPPAAGTSDAHLDRVSKYVVSAAARLCHGLQLPLLRRRNLVEESRELLLRALQERHGPRLQENLLKVQQCLSVDTCPTEAVHHRDKESLTVETDGLWPTDAHSISFKSDDANQSCFDTQKRASFKTRRESLRFNWMPTPHSHQNLDQTADWLASPSVEKVGSLLDDMIRPGSSPQFCVDFEASGASQSDRLFAPSSTPHWEVKTSAPQGWDDMFSGAKRRESVTFDGFEKSYMNQTTVARERNNGPRFSDHSTHPFLPYPAGLIHRHSVEPRQFPPEPDPFETDRRAFASSSSYKLNCPQDSHHHHHPFIHFNRSPTWPPIRSHHTDMTHFPPSHMLEKYPASPLSSYPSPEHWTFPPMRLY